MNVAVSPLEIFRSKGIPHRRIEEWKYSDLRSVLDAETVARAGKLDLRFVELPEGVKSVVLSDEGMPQWAVNCLALSSAAGGAMDAAARAFVTNGAALQARKGLKATVPIRLDVGASGHGQIVLFVEEGASVTLLETHDDEGEGLRNLSISVNLADGASLTHIRRAPQCARLVRVESVSVHATQGARYCAHFADFGARLSRTSVQVRLAGSGAEANLSGVCVLSGEAHADITTHVDHGGADTRSVQLFKAVAGGHARAIYQGKITVSEGANGSDSRQTAKALLLGTRAEADLKPELEILADDVKCAHGAAVGDLDSDSVFYLRSRGIPEREARALLIRGFLEEVVAEIADDNARTAVWTLVEDNLAKSLEIQP